MARSLLIEGPVSLREAARVQCHVRSSQQACPFQTAPPKAARSDPSPGTDSFGALVDSSARSDTGNDRAASAAQQQYAPQRRADDAAASNDNTRSRDAAPVDQSARNNSDDRDAAARQVSDRNADANRDAVQRSQAKSRALKAGIAKSAEKPASDKTSDSSEVPAASAPQGDPPATTSNAVAVAIPVTIASDRCSRCDVRIRRCHGAACDCGCGDGGRLAGRRCTRRINSADQD